jgi:hypothetical protein
MQPTNQFFCETCGAPLDASAASCPFDVPEANAPWRADYEAMARGEMTHEEHQVIVARWIVHNEQGQSEKALQKMRLLAANNRGRRIKLFEFDAG